jgi:23S rRNA (guanosine2251-2'-O)-methyltransferase
VFWNDKQLLIKGGQMSQDEELICGINAVSELIQRQPGRIQQLYLVENCARRLKELSDRAHRAKISVKTVPATALDRLAGAVRHQGVAAQVTPFVFTPLKELLETVLKEPATPVLVALDGVTDPRNLGAIIRTAAAAGVAGLLLPERRSATINATVAKTAAGALESLPISKIVNLADSLRRCQEQGFWVYGAVASGGENLYQVEWPAAVVLVLGSEDKGLRPLVAKHCDHLITIPLARASESLNVGIAAAVTLFEINRSRLCQ